MKDKCQPQITHPACTGDVLVQGPQIPADCPHFHICLPFGAELYYEGGCLNYTPPTIEDGEYGRFVVKDGCIVEALPEDAALYVSPTCATSPAPCNEGDGSAVAPSGTGGNLFTYDASGRPLVLLNASAGDGVSVRGTGTPEDPILISNTHATPEATQLRSGNSALVVSGTGTAAAPFVLTHKNGVQLNNSNGMTFDAQGHLIDYEAPTTPPYVTGVVEGEGITSSTNSTTGIVTVSLKDIPNAITEVVVFGGYSVSLEKNRIKALTKDIDIIPGDYVLGDYTVTLNATGSIVDLAPGADIGKDPTIVTNSASKHFLDGAENRVMTFTTAVSANFHVTYIGEYPDDTTVYIDGSPLPGMMTGTRLDALSVAIYAPGEHTVTFHSASAGFTKTGTGVVNLTVTL